ncbi:integrator complex subunit 12 [Agrilus planipennis]|uniref:Integrator complex subunit 12 n=1 Tax=Agrilus planipennis TaxID=224129 RepID=A0A1W4WIH8_AGRPL|nr:integrator complex subunit 12 [Agrilus planipennis]
MSLNDLDPYYIKSISALHSYSFLSGEPCDLQIYLEDAIKNKSGLNKELSSIISTAVKQNRLDEIKPHINVLEESKTASSSDNELEELMDLMCIVCNEMDVGARNRLLECSGCHALYHQECHRPPVTSLESDGTWVCQNCKDAKKLKRSPMHASPSRVPSPLSSSSSKLKLSTSQIRSSTSPLYKSGGSNKSSPISWEETSGKLSHSGKSPSNISSSNCVTPNINIISADKRLQIIKKKAAKFHDKRK